MMALGEMLKIGAGGQKLKPANKKMLSAEDAARIVFQRKKSSLFRG